MELFLKSLVNIPVGFGNFLLDYFQSMQTLGWLDDLVLVAVPFVTLFVLHISVDLIFSIKKKI